MNLLEIQIMNHPRKNPSAGLPESLRDPITHRFIGHAMKVHSLVGPGLNEEIYHQELVAALTAAGIPHLSKPRRDHVYRGIVADTFEPDFVIEDHFIPELKSLRGKFSAEHLVQVFCYCKFWRLRTSLLVDFGKQSLIWERLLCRSHTGVTIASLVIEDTCAVLVTALNDGINAADRAILQTHLRWLKLDWGIVFHFGKTTADLCFVRRPTRANTFSPADSGRPTD